MKSSKEEVQNRRDKVLDYIVSKETTSIDELSMFFSVSSITIRRDIEELRNNDMVDMRNGIVTINPRYKRHLKDNHHAAE
ncbi:MAG: DeoR family transcriptional regulator, partial [Erysipelotrichaceae bacterium]|nr:DeoR family transcriptional regulator [Erysipelotrichaceae bacterium]